MPATDLSPFLIELGRHEGVVFLSALSLAELQRGLYAGLPESALRQVRLRRILDTIPVLAFDATAAETYGRILAQIGWARRKDFDRLIAAHALATGCTLVTANEFGFLGYSRPVPRKLDALGLGGSLSHGTQLP